MTPDDNNTIQYVEMFIKGFSEVLGREEFQELCLMMPVHDSELGYVKGIYRQLIAVYGQNSGDGIAFRAGRSAFSYYFQKHAAEDGFLENDFRLRPVATRLKLGLNMLTSSLSSMLGIETIVKETDEDYCIYVNQVPASEKMFLNGFIQEFFFWVSNGKVFPLKNRIQPASDGVVVCVNKSPFDL